LDQGTYFGGKFLAKCLAMQPYEMEGCVGGE